MMIELVRVFQSSRCTVGILIVNRSIIGVTLELPDRSNATNISRIPAGRYAMTVRETAERGSHLMVHDVYGRTGILIHTGNSVKDTEGCILPGLYCKNEAGSVTVHESRKVLDELLAAIRTGNSNSLVIHIREAF